MWFYRHIYSSHGLPQQVNIVTSQFINLIGCVHLNHSDRSTQRTSDFEISCDLPHTNKLSKVHTTPSTLSSAYRTSNIHWFLMVGTVVDSTYKYIPLI
jgi:hypothetical protein